MAGDLTVEACGNVFQSREASSNYGIGSDGRRALYVDERDASWCSSDPRNDNRAITIEVANCGGAPDWPVSKAAYESLILLITDICKRNNIKQLLWKGDKSLISQVDKQNMTVHRWFKNKACPGNCLYDHHGDIARRVNLNLNNEEEDMDGKEIVQKITTYLEGQPTSTYAEESSKKAIKSGLFADDDKDGLVDDPKGFVTREQLAVVLNRAGLLD